MSKRFLVYLFFNARFLFYFIYRRHVYGRFVWLLAALWGDHPVKYLLRGHHRPLPSRGLLQLPDTPAVSDGQPASDPRTSRHRPSRAALTVCWRRHRALPGWPKNSQPRDRFAVRWRLTTSEYSRPALRRPRPLSSPVLLRCSVVPPSNVCTASVASLRRIPTSKIGRRTTSGTVQCARRPGRVTPLTRWSGRNRFDRTSAVVPVPPHRP